jgi:hypothetical protein
MITDQYNHNANKLYDTNYNWNTFQFNLLAFYEQRETTNQTFYNPWVQMGRNVNFIYTYSYYEYGPYSEGKRVNQYDPEEIRLIAFNNGDNQGNEQTGEILDWYNVTPHSLQDDIYFVISEEEA